MENTANKMTARNFYNAIAAGTINNELMEYAAEALRKMDEANEKRKTKVSPSQLENEKLKNEIAEKMGCKQQNVSYYVKQIKKKIGHWLID